MTYILTQLGRTNERGIAGTSERDQLSEIIFMFSGFIAAIGAHSISEEVVRCFLYGFPEDKSLCILSLVIDFYACYSPK